jgi:hypothetical protein
LKVQPLTGNSRLLFHVKTIIGISFKMMLKILLNHLLRQFSRGHAKKILVLQKCRPQYRFFTCGDSSKILPLVRPCILCMISEDDMLGVADTQDMDMILAHYSTQYLDLELLTYLTNKFSQPNGKIPGQHMNNDVS